MTPLAIAGVGVCGSGLRGWAEAASLLRRERAFDAEPIGKLTSESLPPVERRRANDTSRLAIAAAQQAIGQQTEIEQRQLSTVFSSSDGDTVVLEHLLAALARPEIVLSPTLFHNSVFNAPAGYWSLGSGAQAPSTTVCAGAVSFAAGLCEARAQIVASNSPVLYVSYDVPFPESLRAFGGGKLPFACALLLQPNPAGAPGRFGSIDQWRQVDAKEATAVPLADEFANNSAAAGLSLLAAIAGGARTPVYLPYVDDSYLRLIYTP